MGDHLALDSETFVDDSGTVREKIPSSVITPVPAAKAAAEQYGRQVRFDFLDDRAVHWLLFQRREDTERGGLLGCLLAIPVFVLGFGAWPFWDLVASEKSRAFQLAFIAADVLLLIAFSVAVFLLRLPVLSRSARPPRPGSGTARVTTDNQLGQRRHGKGTGGGKFGGLVAVGSAIGLHDWVRSAAGVKDITTPSDG
ncbi:hypothetical protein [Streptomyces sasae]|uniref:hypothetical protein n=1 Tax=Streptomyces sasae TaxID=1266772 RepID=UPI00292E1DEB|nr:hypothetical protein [Streptomyces sasae]